MERPGPKGVPDSPPGVQELCERYGLQSDPFLESPGRFFGGGQRQHYLETLRHLCSFGDLLLVVEGEPGVGRTRLVNEFIRGDKAALVFHALGHRELVSTAALAKTLWGLLRQTVPASEPERAVEAFFQSDHWQRYSGKRWVLVVDDADTAPPGAIGALVSGFRQANRDRAPVPLLIAKEGYAAGLEALVETAVNSGVGSAVEGAGKSARLWSHCLRVRPLDATESAHFVESCIRWAGGDPVGLLGPQRRHRLYAASGGVFTRIKQVAPQIILGGGADTSAATAKTLAGGATGREGGGTSRTAGKKRSSLWLALAIVALLASYGIVSWQYGPSDNGLGVRLDKSSAPDTDPVATAHAPAPDADEVERMRAAIAAAEQQLQQQGPARAPEELELPLQPRAQSGESKAAVQPGNGPLLPESLGIPVERLLASALSRAQDGTLAGARSPNPIPLQDDGRPPGPPVDRAAEPGSDAGIAQPASSNVADALPEPEPEPEPEQPAIAGFQPQMPGAFRDRAWVADLPPGSVTVQLLGSYNEETAVKLIQRYPNAGFVYILSTYKGKPWFVVLLDVFDDAAPARKAIARLPAAIRRTGPWIRDVEGL